MNTPLRLSLATIGLAAVLSGGTTLQAQTPSTDEPKSASPAMQQFAILFRQGSRELTEAELKSRADATRKWAQQQNAAGHDLDPHILAPESVWAGPETGAGCAPITAILFLQARDLAEAAEVARAHPAVQYGSSVEVRPWAAPAAAAR